MRSDYADNTRTVHEYRMQTARPSPRLAITSWRDLVCELQHVPRRSNLWSHYTSFQQTEAREAALPHLVEQIRVGVAYCLPILSHKYHAPQY
jgi:hypothetical protein